MNRNKPSVEIKVDDLELFFFRCYSSKGAHVDVLEKDFEEGDMPV